MWQIEDFVIFNNGHSTTKRPGEKDPLAHMLLFPEVKPLV